MQWVNSVSWSLHRNLSTCSEKQICNNSKIPELLKRVPGFLPQRYYYTTVSSGMSNTKCLCVADLCALHKNSLCILYKMPLEISAGKQYIIGTKDK